MKYDVVYQNKKPTSITNKLTFTKIEIVIFLKTKFITIINVLFIIYNHVGNGKYVYLDRIFEGMRISSISCMCILETLYSFFFYMYMLWIMSCLTSVVVCSSETCLCLVFFHIFRWRHKRYSGTYILLRYVSNVHGHKLLYMYMCCGFDIVTTHLI